jgi:hypothetical protein
LAAHKKHVLLAITPFLVMQSEIEIQVEGQFTPVQGRLPTKPLPAKAIPL